jgi:hypothetical protein
MSSCYQQSLQDANYNSLKKKENYSCGYCRPKKGKEKVLKEYFGTIMPSAMKNGFTPLD